MVAMEFKTKDLFRSVRMAFGFQRLWLQFLGLVIGYSGYLIFTYATIFISGQDMNTIWDRFGLLPGVFDLALPWYGWLLFVAGVLWFFFFAMVAGCSVARASYMNIKGNTFYTWKEAFRFSLRKKGGSLIATPLAILIIAAIIAVGGGIVGVLGRIPIIGPLGVSLFGIFWFAASFFLLLVIFALGISWLLTPAILATTDDDAFEGIFQSFSILLSQPFHLIFYEAIVIILSILSFGVFTYLAKQTWGLMTLVLSTGMGSIYADLSYGASYLIQNWFYPVHMWSKVILGGYAPAFLFSHEFTSISLSGIMPVATFIFAVMMAFIAGYVASFPVAVFNVGQTFIFLLIKKSKDDENLLERKDKEEEFDDEEDEENDAPKAADLEKTE